MVKLKWRLYLSAFFTTMPKPFHTIATAVALSPNLEANICESIRLKNCLGYKLLLIHVEQGTPKERENVQAILEKTGCEKAEVEMVWETGSTIEAILKTCAQRKVDLLIAGALPHEGLLRYYKGSVARQLVRKSNCSILLLTKPLVQAQPCQTVVVNGINHPKTASTIQKAISVSQALQASLLNIIEEVNPTPQIKRADDDDMLQAVTKKRLEITQAEDQRIDKILEGIPNKQGLTIRHKAIIGRPGYTIGHFTQSIGAQLLVLNSPDTKLGFLDRVFTHDLEYILAELPSDLLIVHSSE